MEHQPNWFEKLSLEEVEVGTSLAVSYLVEWICGFLLDVAENYDSFRWMTEQEFFAKEESSQFRYWTTSHSLSLGMVSECGRFLRTQKFFMNGGGHEEFYEKLKTRPESPAELLSAYQASYQQLRGDWRSASVWRDIIDDRLETDGVMQAIVARAFGVEKPEDDEELDDYYDGLCFVDGEIASEAMEKVEGLSWDEARDLGAMAKARLQRERDEERKSREAKRKENEAIAKKRTELAAALLPGFRERLEKLSGVKFKDHRIRLSKESFLWPHARSLLVKMPKEERQALVSVLDVSNSIRAEYG
jgi:hypothetical protein